MWPPSWARKPCRHGRAGDGAAARFRDNRNTIRRDIQDWQVKFDSMDPSDAGFGQFTLSGNGSTTANLPMQPGPGGALRPGWFTNFCCVALEMSPPCCNRNDTSAWGGVYPVDEKNISAKRNGLNTD